jgi:hypothetical protein
MKWKDHDRWATKLGIEKEVSNEVNRIIDAVEQGENIPDKYEQHLEKCAEKTGESSPKSAFGIVAADYAKRRHDVSRGNKTGDELSARLHKCALEEMGEQYLDAWYLHHHLDLIHEYRDSGKSLEEILFLHKKDAPQTYSKTIAEFLRDYRSEIPELG